MSGIRFRNDRREQTAQAPCGRILAGEAGFTLIEFIVVLVITSIVTALFSQILVTLIQISNSHATRQSGLIDCRRSFDMMTHDVREWNTDVSVPAATLIKFFKYSQ